MSVQGVAVMGPMFSGKTTLTKELLRLYPGTATKKRMSFAMPVKKAALGMLMTFDEVASNALDTSYKIDFDSDNEDAIVAYIDSIKHHPSIRTFLQVVGTELGRNWYSDGTLWTDIFTKRFKDFERMLAFHELNGLVVVDDCRFLNEAACLRNLDFMFVRIIRPDDERIAHVTQAVTAQNPQWSHDDIRFAVQKMMSHPSETEQTKIAADLTFTCRTTNDVHDVASFVLTEVTAKQNGELNGATIYP